MKASRQMTGSIVTGVISLAVAHMATIANRPSGQLQGSDLVFYTPDQKAVVLDLRQFNDSPTRRQRAVLLAKAYYSAFLWVRRLPHMRGLAALLTGFAVFLAGRKRMALHEEWRAHLAGESGHDRIGWRRTRDALGFIAAAIRCRLGDGADVAWRPVDAILTSRKLSNLLVFGPTAVAAVFILRDDGIVETLRSAGGIAAIGGMLYGLVRVGRWYRDVKPPEPKTRLDRE